jgi:acylphosphatase
LECADKNDAPLSSVVECSLKVVRLIITGRVQGVGYRDWTQAVARQLGLSGWVRNRLDETVEAVFAGEAATVDRMVAACRRGPSLARVAAIEMLPADAADVPDGFTRRPTA